MPTSALLITILLWTAILGVVIVVWWYPLFIEYRAERRLKRYVEDEPEVVEEGDEGYTLSRRWLFVAGFRSRWALPVFLVATLIGIILGSMVRAMIQASAVPQAVKLLEAFPGNVGHAFVPLALIMPWVAFFMFAAAPYLFVRAARQRRLDQISSDLPVTMELLATLCESGLGFDAAVERIMSTLGRKRPVVTEFNTFRIEIMSGRARIECFRRLADRVDYSPFTVFISAVVQAEQVGSSVSTVMRAQAEDMHSRRREQAMEFVMGRPLKLLLPMVIGFLPGVFVWALGPVFYDLVSTLTGLISPVGRLK